MEEEYNVPIICSSVDTVSKDELNNMLRTALYEFPVVDINVNIPKWIDILPMENEIKMHYLEKIKEAISGIIASKQKQYQEKTELLNKLNSDFNSDLKRYTAVRKA